MSKHVYFVIGINQWILIVSGLIAIRLLSPSLNLGLGLSNLQKGLKRTYKSGIIVVLWYFVAFLIGLIGKFDYQPTIYKVLVEAILYNISVAILEELYCRGLMLNILDRLHFLINGSCTTLAAFKLNYTYPSITIILSLIGPVIFALSGLYLVKRYEKLDLEDSLEERRVGFPTDVQSD